MRRRLWGMLTLVTLLLPATWIGANLLSPHQLHADADADDTTTWGTDHINQEVPEYSTGGECLFCHRDYVGPRWPHNAHSLSMRVPEAEEPAMTSLRKTEGGDAIADEVTMMLGAQEHIRYLKKLPAYGKAAILDGTFHVKAGGGTLDPATGLKWDDDLFNNKCAGCHATAIDPETAGFGSPGLDCFVCHGIVAEDHATVPGTAIFSTRKAGDPRIEVASCGQCHLRGGKAKSNDRPYPNNFVPGDNLLRDFQVDFSEESLKGMDIIEQHIFANSRHVLVGKKTAVTCTSCHSIHGESTKKHTELAETKYCTICHEPGKAMNDVKLPSPRQSKTCQY